MTSLIHLFCWEKAVSLSHAGTIDKTVFMDQPANHLTMTTTNESDEGHH